MHAAPLPGLISFRLSRIGGNPDGVATERRLATLSAHVVGGYQLRKQFVLRISSRASTAHRTLIVSGPHPISGAYNSFGIYHAQRSPWPPKWQSSHEYEGSRYSIYVPDRCCPVLTVRTAVDIKSSYNNSSTSRAEQIPNTKLARISSPRFVSESGKYILIPHPPIPHRHPFYRFFFVSSSIFLPQIHPSKSCFV